jgi:hypothetical protein
MLQNKMKPVIHRHRDEDCCRVFFFAQQLSHSAANTKETLPELKFEAVNYPPYIPDFTLSDFHLFGPLNGALGGN